MAQYATKDELNELTGLVRTLQGNVQTLDTSVGELDTLVERINHLSTLKDVTITYLTEGDLIQYSSDGTWHNVSPAALADYISGEGGIIDTAVVKALIALEDGKLFLSKLYDDTALGVITFKNSVIADSMIYAKKGITIGNYISGLLGDGAIIDEHGNIEAGSLTLREFLSMPELRFNRVDVVSGELWNSIAFGTIESVDTKNQIATLKLEEGEYSGLHVNDICRGIWHNISGVNETTPGIDECGFEKMQGFSTAYFTPIEILDERGKQFRYSLKPNTTQHPTANMKFAVYGNFLDETRQSSAYSTRDYKRFLKDVSTWAIDWTNIASQFGKIEGLTIPGAPDDGVLHGDGAYLTNVYMTGAMIQFTPEQEDSLKGQDAYSVNLTKDNLSVIVDNELNILDKYSQLDNLTFGVQAFKGTTELSYSDVYAEGSYFLTWEATGLKCTMANGIFTITDILSVTNSPHIDLLINCEGNATFKKTVVLQFHLQPNSLWTTYNDNDAIPDRPTGDGTTNGWHRNYTASAIWMSTKSSIEVDDPNVEWGDPNRFRGASVAGKDGEYTRFAYTESSVPPPTPIGDTVPPKDPNNKYTWTMDPPQGDPEKGIWVWQSIQTVYSDKSTSGWSEPFRLTGADGKDGEDGNSIEFLYARNNDKDNYPQKPNSNQTTDWTGTGPDGTQWFDNPQGVDDSHRYEYVTQRYKDKSTQKWGDYSQPGLWSVFADKGKDGDGYEYIFARFSSYDQAALCSRNEQYYPASPTYGSQYLNGDYQQDDYIPTKTCKGATFTYTDNGVSVTESIPYQVCWTRKKENGKWGDWKDGFIWTKWGKDGQDGQDGDKGDQGDKGEPGTPGTDATTYIITPGAATIRLTRTSSYEPSSMTFRAYKKTGTGSLSSVSGYWEIYGSNNHAPTTSSEGTEVGSGWSGVSSITFNIASSAKYNYYTVAFNPSEYPLYNDNPVAASATVTVVVDGQNGQDRSAANTQYTDIRFRGVWNSSTRYYYATASSIGLTNYENPSNAYVRDQVIYKGGVYLVKTVNSGGVYGQTPSSSSSYWELVSSVSAMAINTLLADNAVLGAFHFSNNVFWSGDGGSSSSAAKLYMNSSTGEFRASNGTFTGTVNAKAGTFKDLYFENCFTKNRFLNITHLNRSSSDIDDPKCGDTYCSNNKLYSYQSDGWEEALELYTNSTNAISVYANPSYSKIIHMTGAKGGYTNKLILPSVSEDNYGTEMTIVCRQYPSIRAITGTEGDLHIVTYDSRGSTYTDERTLVLAKGNNGGILNVVSTPQGWLITNCSHDGCSDSGIILKFRVQYDGSSYAVVSSSIHSIYNFDNSKISCTRSGAGAVGITIISGTSYFWTPCDVRVYGSYRTEGITGSNAHPIYATLISYSTAVTTLNISVQLADDDTLNDGNFYVDIYGGFAQYIRNNPT